MNTATLLVCMVLGLFCMVHISDGACADEWPKTHCERAMAATGGSCGAVVASNCQLTCGECQLEICENAYSDAACEMIKKRRGCDDLVTQNCAKTCNNC
ncbi:hypothetical protein ACHWQZ_G012860 [Mnemiopsis leidyi]